MCSTSLIVPVTLFAGISSALAMFAFSVLKAAAPPINCINLRRSTLAINCSFLSRF